LYFANEGFYQSYHDRQWRKISDKKVQNISFKNGDKIGVLLNVENRTVSFYYNHDYCGTLYLKLDLLKPFVRLGSSKDMIRLFNGNLKIPQIK
jgi:hypothetical protein